MARVPLPRALRQRVLGAAAAVLRMDLSEAAEPLSSFGSLDDLFVRKLRPGARVWPSAEGVPGSPVDGVVGQVGEVRKGRALQAKGRWYSVAELLDDAALAARFAHGTFVTLYLAPHHYHRIHAPVSGQVRQARHIPGRLLPVNAPAVAAIDRLFPRNERLVTLIEPAGSGAEAAAGGGSGGGSGGAMPDGGRGAVAVVAVGAFNVGRITADYDETLVTNRTGARAETRLYEPPLAVTRGDGLMAFHLGSTVVLLFERGVALQRDVAPGRDIRLGAPLGTLSEAGGAA